MLSLGDGEHQAKLHEEDVFTGIKYHDKADLSLDPEFPTDMEAIPENMELSDIIDVAAIQLLMDEFYNLTKIGIAIVDMRGKVLVANGWQEICTRFHRQHPETARNCIESDCALSIGVRQEYFRLYRCKNNMWDIATPINVGNIHVGNLFLGQFLFEDENPNIEVFRQQAKKYGFNEKEYLSALSKIPRWSREKVETVMRFYSRLAVLISGMGYKNFQLSQLNEQNKILLKRTREEEEESSLRAENIAKLMSIASHEIRHCISVIKGYADILTNNGKCEFNFSNETAYGILHAIKHSSERLLKLEDSLMNVSMIETGFVSIEPQEICLLKLIEEVVEEMMLINENNPIGIKTTSCDDRFMCTLDKNKLQQVLTILIDNAFKYSDEGLPLEIGIEKTDSGDLVAVRVMDRGRGVPARIRDKIFELNFQNEEDKANSKSGMGLGLYIAKRIVEAHGGRIFCEERDGGGSVFTFTMSTHMRE